MSRLMIACLDQRSFAVLISSLLLTGCAGLSSDQRVIDISQMNVPVTTHAAELLNKKYNILSRSETKELEWRNAIILDAANAALPEGANPQSMARFNTVVQSTALNKMQNQCAECGRFVTDSLSLARIAVKRPFSASQLIAYDLDALPSMYTANQMAAGCQLPIAATLSSQIAYIEKYVIARQFVTQDAIQKMKMTSSASEPCDGSVVSTTVNMGAYRAARLVDNISFSQESEQLRNQ